MAARACDGDVEHVGLTQMAEGLRVAFCVDGEREEHEVPLLPLETIGSRDEEIVLLNGLVRKPCGEDFHQMVHLIAKRRQHADRVAAFPG